MSRDYKNRVGRKQRRTLSPWIGVAAGLLIGLFVAFLVFIKLQARQQEPVYAPAETLPPPVADTAEDVRDVLKEPDSSIPPPPPKPRFDFYTLLPEIEVVVPEEEIEQSRQPPPAAVVEPPKPAATPALQQAPVAAVKPPAPTATPKPAPAPASGAFYLQIGSFSDAGKAETLKAQLALMGLQTSIQTADIQGKGTYHRVRVGPFATLDELDRTRSRLKQKGIDSTPIKVRG